MNMFYKNILVCNKDNIFCNDEIIILGLWIKILLMLLVCIYDEKFLLI